MRFPLKDYQWKTFASAIDNIKTMVVGRSEYFNYFIKREDKCDKYATAVIAPTGAGKTVVATAIIEAILRGNAETDMPADDKAVILWFSKEPELNVQTRSRILEASSLISPDMLKIIGTDFREESLSAGKVYFISNGKLASHSNLVKDHVDFDLNSEDDDTLFPEHKGSEGGYSFWDTIKNTIDEGKNLYLFIDEAHQGMKTPAKSAERTTIIRQLIDGRVPGAAIPFVIGISATADRFTDAMYKNKDRKWLETKTISIQEVRESGLLKDEVVLAGVHQEKYAEDKLLGMGCKRLVEYKENWDKETSSTEESSVEPLMIVQVPNKVSDATLTDWKNVIIENIPGMQMHNMANVFGEHEAIKLSDGTFIEYIEPSDIQERTRVRVVFAKDAITTGWDCPRAEVLVSFRPTNEMLTITQMIGRMVRQPLKRSIQGNDFLNSVYCVLPSFDYQNVGKVAQVIKNGDNKSDAIPVDTVTVEPAEVSLNPVLIDDLGEETMNEYLDKMSSLPTQSKPKSPVSPMTLLNELVAKLTSNYESMQKKTGKSMDIKFTENNNCFVADNLGFLISKYHDQVERQKKEILEIDVYHRSMTTDGELDSSVRMSKEAADTKVIDGYFRKADITFKRNATIWMKQRVGTKPVNDLKLEIAALSYVPSAVSEFEDNCREQFKRLYRENQHAIGSSSDRIRAEYENLRSRSGEVTVDRVGSIESTQVSYSKIENGTLVDLPLYDSHLLADGNGKYPVKINPMERSVIEKELSKPHIEAWYRNPAVESKPSVRVARDNMDGTFSYIYPDFLFFGKDVDGEVIVSIVDPHGRNFGNSDDRLNALCDFAEEHGSEFYEIIAVDDGKKGKEYRALNLNDPYIRKAIKDSPKPSLLFSDPDLSYSY